MEMKQNETFRGSYSNLTLFFIGYKMLNYFNGFNNWHLSISLQKSAETSEMKLNGTCANLTVFFLINKGINYLNVY